MLTVQLSPTYNGAIHQAHGVTGAGDRTATLRKERVRCTLHPHGKVSINDTPVNAKVFSAGLEIVNVSVVVPPAEIVSAKTAWQTAAER
jgi:hypothetical protein